MSHSKLSAERFFCYGLVLGCVIGIVVFLVIIL